MKNIHAFRFKEKGSRRYFATYRIGGEDLRRIETKLEVVWRKHVSVGFCFHIGNRGSETPVDVMVSFGFLAFFWSLDFPRLGEFCEWLGRGYKRNISLKIHDKTLWWELWYDDDMGYDDHHKCDSWRQPKLYPWRWGRKKHRPWMCLRRGNIDLNPIDAFWGHRLYDFHPVGPRIETQIFINQFDGDSYDVDFTLKKQTRGRRLCSRLPVCLTPKTDRG